MRRFVFVLLPFVLAVNAHAQVLPTGLKLTPAGRQISLPGTLALGVCRVPGTPYAVVNCGGGLQSLTVIDTHTGQTVSSVAYQTANVPPAKGQAFDLTGSAWYGLAAFGRTVYAAGGGTDTVHVYQLSPSGTLMFQRDLSEPTGNPKQANFPAGLAVSGDGTRLFAANNLSDTLAVWNTKTGKLLGRVPVGSYPLAVAVTHSGALAYVASEREGGVSVVDPVRMRRVAWVKTGSHPDALLLSRDGSTLFIGNAGSDTVSVVSTRTRHVVDTLLLRPAEARGLPGVSPTGLVLSTDEHTLYVTLADWNAVAVVDMQKQNGLALRGLLPAGWYPSAVCVAGDGRHLCIVNAKGSAARIPNTSGPQPDNSGSPARYVNYVLHGTVSFVPIPTDKTLRAATRIVLQNVAGAGANVADEDAARRIAALPITHVLYIIKENRTYDQILGDMAGANGDPSLALFGKTVTPNAHALASRFCTLDNYFCCAEVSADGWNWSTSGFANDYVQRTVAESYGERRKSPRPAVRPYDYEGQNRDKSPALSGLPDVAESAGGYLWDNALRHGLSVRNYGCFLADSDDGTSAGPTQPQLARRTCPDFAPFAMTHTDSDAWRTLHLPPPGQYLPREGEQPSPSLAIYKGQPSRYSAWKREWDGYVRNGNLPALEIIRLPRDHTAGTTPPLDTPAACVADNDYAVGEIVAAVSHSRFWRSTSIFVVEDDAQSGPDHVDCHRSVCFVASPFVKRGRVDSRFYNTDSTLRTIEVLLHLPPMTRLDAGARPLDVFQSTPDFAPYTAALPSRALLSGKNEKTAYGAKESAHLNFARADDVPDAALNRILWRNAHGARAVVPAVRGGE